VLAFFCFVLTSVGRDLAMSKIILEGGRKLTRKAEARGGLVHLCDSVCNVSFDFSDVRVRIGHGRYLFSLHDLIS
jgi:hypothetical protein